MLAKIGDLIYDNIMSYLKSAFLMKLMPILTIPTLGAF